MAVLAFRAVPGVLFLAYAGLMLFQWLRWVPREKGERRWGWLDLFAGALFFLGHVPAAIYLATRWMDRFYVHVPPVLRVVGVPLMLLGVFVLFAAHRTLGNDWSPVRELGLGKTFRARGPYRFVREPLAAGYWLMGLGLLILSANWLVGGAFLGSLALLCLVRIPADEKIMAERFGEAYRRYAADTDRLLPRELKAVLGKRWVKASALLVVMLGLAASGGVTYAGLTDELGKADVGVVLGSKVFRSGRPGPSLTSRLNAALRLYREGWYPEILVSGGLDPNGNDEAQVMQRYLIDRGVPAERVHTDSLGVNTRATARNAAVFMHQRGMKSAMIVSQFYHVPRAQMALRRSGIVTVYGAHARFFEWHDVYAVPREVAGMAWYWVRGN
jgi:protein-S-isoprenylcysteine O-methyltransferase Ste14/vancomycin permeability regulator SanA